MELVTSILWYLGAAVGVLGTLALIAGSFAIATLERDDEACL